MKIENLVEILENDLANEYAHWHFYMQASTRVRGISRLEISEFFLEQATSEMKHIEQFRRLIQGLKTRRKIHSPIPSTVANFPSTSSFPRELLKEAFDMEEQVVKNYVKRHKQAQKFAEGPASEDEIDGTYIALFLEDQILDSRSDADNILEMLQEWY